MSKTYNPYNNNPFATDTKTVKNEKDANRELSRSIARDLRKGIGDVFAPMTKDELGFWK